MYRLTQMSVVIPLMSFVAKDTPGSRTAVTVQQPHCSGAAPCLFQDWPF